MERDSRRFYFKLALAMNCTVRELLARIDSHELTEWMAYDSIAPFGSERADINAATVASTVANCMGSKQRYLKDFLPKFMTEEPPTEEELIAKVIAMNASLGGTTCQRSAT